MKIYLASSWKNEKIVRGLAGFFRKYGHEVDCFCDASSGRYVFDAHEIDNYYNLDAISFLKNNRTQKAYQEDKKWLDWADVVILILPCGRSAHLEAGYKAGQGGKLYILGEFPKGEWDVMYGMADKLFRFTDINELVIQLKNDEAEDVPESS